MLNSFFATKLESSQTFDQKGNRLVITLLKAEPLTITQLKTKAKDGYAAVQCAIQEKSLKSLTKPLKGHLKKGFKSKSPLFLREIDLTQTKDANFKIGNQIKLEDALKPGDQIKVTGISKGRGFAGVMKRYKFAGGPRTHGQSDRERAPGSIGQGTDPGRVWKGKKMPGHFGVETKTIKNLQVLSFDPQTSLLTITGTVPGSRNSLVKLTKTGTPKNVIQLPQEKKESTKKTSKKESAKPKDKPEEKSKEKSPKKPQPKSTPETKKPSKPEKKTKKDTK